jgi:quinol monooxygenase YgiN
VAIEPIDAPGHLEPAACVNYNAILTPDIRNSIVFWNRYEDASQFRVLWEGAEIARCDLFSGSCELWLPPAEE